VPVDRNSSVIDVSPADQGSVMRASGQRLLFITLSNIGDLILTTPALLALHAAFPTHRIDVIADARSSALLAACPFLGRLHHRDKRAGLRGLLRLIRALRETRYDAIVDLRTDVIPWLLRGRARAARWQRGTHGLHATEQHLAVVARVLPRLPPMPRACVWVSADDEAFAAAAIPAGERVLALAPGANWPGKIWPSAYYAELTARCAAAFSSVLLLGGPADRATAAALGAACPLPVYDFVGRSTLTQAAALLDRATAFVGNDSGLGHLAAARDVATLTLFGPGRPEKYRPWGKNVAIVQAPAGNLATLTPEVVADALSNLLALSTGRADE
jgi:heptosyltransferase-3